MVFGVLILAAAGCGTGGSQTTGASTGALTDSSAQAKSSLQAPPITERNWNDLARFLAGKQPQPNSTLATLENTPEAAEHRKFFAEKWQNKNQELYDKLLAFGQEEFPTEQAFTGNVLYPFSGPDIITALTVYPKASRYVLFGLEPEGDLPDISKLPVSEIGPNLQNIRHSLDAMVKQSFFMTNEMRIDFRRKALNGTTPVLLLFLALKDQEVLKVRRVRIDGTGRPVELTPQDDVKQTTEDTVVTGVAIDFRAENTSEVRTLYYFSADVSDVSLDGQVKPWAFKNQTGFHRFILQQAPAQMYLKAASYLLHGKPFMTIRDLLMQSAVFVFQDDTGIPVRAFEKDPKARWEVKLYGSYAGTLPQFKYAYQADLARRYATDTTIRRNLGFRMGYNHQFNLQIARKIIPAAKP